MNHGFTPLDAMPRLAMVLRAGPELTLHGTARPESNPSAAPLVGHARTWLHACARAQRMMEANSSSDLFSANRPLMVEISGIRHAGSWAEAAERVIGHAPAALAATITAWACSSSIPWIGRFGALAANPFTDPGRFGASASLTKSSTTCSSDSARGAKETWSSTVELPARSQDIDACSPIRLAAPFWSDEEFALYIVLHEFGHSAQHQRTGSPGGMAGIESLPPAERGIFAAAGIPFGPDSPLGIQLMLNLMENYADCFAALALGGSDPDRALLCASRVESMREACIPRDESLYSRGDPVHDTRESLRALRETLEASGSAPSGSAEVDEICMRCAQVGAQRWLAKLSTRPCGELSEALWARSELSLGLPENQLARAGFTDAFETVVADARTVSWIASAVENLADLREARPGISATLKILLEIAEHVGSPRAPLAGTQSPEPEPSGLLAKLWARRSSTSATTSPNPNSLTLKQAVNKKS